jgi:hypothetical protein
MRTIRRAGGIAAAVVLTATALTTVGASASALIHATTNRSRMATFGDGHLRITGTLKVTMTNVRTGQHIGINSSGPVTLWPQTGGGIIAVGRGIGFIALSIEPEEPGQPRGFLLQTKGQTVSDGIDLYLVHGTSRDICPMIS